jgi:hypothetical protein
MSGHSGRDRIRYLLFCKINTLGRNSGFEMDISAMNNDI